MEVIFTETTIHNLNLVIGNADVKRIVVKEGSVDTQELQIKFYDNNTLVTNFTNWDRIVLYAHKSDNTKVVQEVNPTYSNNKMIFKPTEQVFTREGTVKCELEISHTINGNTQVLYSPTFYIYVDPNVISGSEIESSDDIQTIRQVLEEVREDAEYSEEYAQASERWALGTKGGTPVDEEDETYHNNSKYYAEQSSDYEDAAETSADNASTYEATSLTKKELIDGYEEASLTNKELIDGYEESALTNKELIDGYKTDALASKNSASQSATNASQSATNASQYEAQALSDKNKIVGYETTSLANKNLIDGYESSASQSASDAQESAENAAAYEGSASQSATGALSHALDSEAWAVGQRNGVDVDSTDDTYENNAKYYAEQAEAVKINNEGYQDLSKSYAVGTNGEVRQGDASDNSKYYYEQARDIASSLSGALKPMGTVVFANLPTTNISAGDMYNISNDFTSDSRFKDGGGISYAAGTNVYYTSDSKWDCLVGNEVTGVKGSAETTYRKGNVEITKANIGLGNVDNTADLDKPISTATQNALNSKANKSNALFVDSISMGRYPDTAIGVNSIAFGANATASGDYSYAQGFSITASGDCSHAQGDRTKASGDCSHAEGFNTEASGNNSHAEGLSTTAGYNNQHVQGKYNKNKSTDIFEVGNGSYGAPSNALELSEEGDLTVSGEITDGNGNKLSEIDNKVDKVQGKGLSSNDFTTSEKDKLTDIESEAQVNVQSDWNVTDTSSDAFIKNKPTIPTDYVKTSGNSAINGGTLDITNGNGKAFKISNDTNSIGLHIGAGGVNRGIYDFGINDWILYRDGNRNIYLNPSGSATVNANVYMGNTANGMYYSSTGKTFCPQTNAGASLGVSSKQWSTVHANTIYENGTSLSSKYLPLTGGTMIGSLGIHFSNGSPYKNGYIKQLSNTSLAICGPTNTNTNERDGIGLEFQSCTTGILPHSSSGTTGAGSRSNWFNLGSSTRKFGTIYAVSTTINSDKKQKKDIKKLNDCDLSNNYEEAFDNIDFVKFRWKENHNDLHTTEASSRYHYGTIVQDVDKALRDNGIDRTDNGIVKASFFADNTSYNFITGGYEAPYHNENNDVTYDYSENTYNYKHSFDSENPTDYEIKREIIQRDLSSINNNDIYSVRNKINYITFESNSKLSANQPPLTINSIFLVDKEGNKHKVDLTTVDGVPYYDLNGEKMDIENPRSSAVINKDGSMTINFDRCYDSYMMKVPEFDFYDYEKIIIDASFISEYLVYLIPGDNKNANYRDWYNNDDLLYEICMDYNELFSLSLSVLKNKCQKQQSEINELKNEINELKELMSK